MLNFIASQILHYLVNSIISIDSSYANRKVQQRGRDGGQNGHALDERKKARRKLSLFIAFQPRQLNNFFCVYLSTRNKSDRTRLFLNLHNCAKNNFLVPFSISLYNSDIGWRSNQLAAFPTATLKPFSFQFLSRRDVRGATNLSSNRIFL